MANVTGDFLHHVFANAPEKLNDTMRWEWLKSCVPPASRVWYRHKNAVVYPFLPQTFESRRTFLSHCLGPACAWFTHAVNVTHSGNGPHKPEDN
jgi:hypothetical protein